MSRQPRNSGPVTPAAPAARMNEYFVPRDGIDREVISADICRYLGNDALVRPGHYENPQTGQNVQGYYITAYRNLTTAMIEDLKADSARWDSERRSQSTRNASAPGGIQTSRDGPIYVGTPSSNSHLGQYRYSETHNSRQNLGPTSDTPQQFQQDGYDRDPSYDAPKYPGTGGNGYAGASPSYPQRDAHPQASGYMPPSGGNYGGYSQNPNQNQGPPTQDMRYAQHSGPMMNQGFQAQDTAPYIATGTNMPASRNFQGDSYNNQRTSVSSVHIPQPTYAAPVQGHQSYNSPASQHHPQAHPVDVGYGRGPQQGYPQTPQYDDAPAPPPSRSTASPSHNTPSSGAGNDRRNEREHGRLSSDRHQRPPPRR
ncbi:hypothetical protein VHEMI07124 [[Torrubiella] hemipterigena]|uniref:Transcription factor RfeG n=1 Tax=[Torrubiella] hemipterigena TaxID=1531966 RepID=A0A0A1T9C8_9HYPO|nr:hypothetical protein VHEMI07124 [[Torrubiella] hemipterigena]